MKIRTMTLTGVTLVAVVALGVLGTLRWASAIGSDVNNDGRVNIIDIGHIVRDYGQIVPTPTPPTGGGNERIVVDDFLLDGPSNVSIGSFDPSSCEGATLYIAAKVDESVVADPDVTMNWVLSVIDPNDATGSYSIGFTKTTSPGTWEHWVLLSGSDTISNSSLAFARVDVGEAQWGEPTLLRGNTQENTPPLILHFELHCAASLP